MKTIVFFVLIFPNMALSQTAGGIANLEKAKEEDVFQARLSVAIPWKEKYRYSEYRDGNVYYSSKKVSAPVKLNYNLLFRKIMVINEMGDTLAIANFDEVKYIRIDKDLYYHDVKRGYFEILSNPNDSIRLAGQRKLKILKRYVLGDAEKPQLTSTNKLFSVLYIPLNPTFNREEVTLSRDVTFFLMEGKGDFYIANKSTFMMLFPKHKKQIEGYLLQMVRQRTPIKFYREEDLRNLLAFCLKQH